MKRINFLALVVFLGVLAWLFFGLDSEARSNLQTRVLSAFTPLFKASAAVADASEEAALAEDYDQGELLEQLGRLQREIAELNILREEFDEVREENAVLRRELEFKNRSLIELIPARIMKRTASNWWVSFIIDKGSEHGIVPDSPVRNEDGLVGKTAQVSATATTVILITDEQCRVAARVVGTPEEGILMGSRGGAESTGLLRLRYLSKDADVPAGRKVYSSGAGGVFPANILLGTVISFERRDIYGEALVQPAVDFSSVRDVFVLKVDQPSTGADTPEEGTGGGGG